MLATLRIMKDNVVIGTPVNMSVRNMTELVEIRSYLDRGELPPLGEKPPDISQSEHGQSEHTQSDALAVIYHTLYDMNLIFPTSRKELLLDRRYKYEVSTYNYLI